MEGGGVRVSARERESARARAEAVRKQRGGRHRGDWSSRDVYTRDSPAVKRRAAKLN